MNLTHFQFWSLYCPVCCSVYCIVLYCVCVLLCRAVLTVAEVSEDGEDVLFC